MPTRIKSTGAKPAAKKHAVKTPARKPRSTPSAKPRYGKALAPEERRRLIAEAAYFKAQKRGFTGGSEMADWIEAEAEIDALLGTKGSA